MSGYGNRDHASEGVDAPLYVRAMALRPKGGQLFVLATFDTIGTPAISEPLHAREIDPPTLSMTFAVNDSPFAGKDGDKVQSRVIRERLEREAEDFFARVARGYDAVAKAEPGRVRRIDSGRSIDEVFDDVLRSVDLN